jgi:DNA-binding XRE family transcriptional regulator
LTGDDDELRAMINEEAANAEVAALIHDVRTSAGLTQKELAERAGTSQPVIARLEDADYQGHSLAMLRRIASALNLCLVVEFRPVVTATRGGKRSAAAVRNLKVTGSARHTTTARADKPKAKAPGTKAGGKTVRRPSPKRP